MIYDAARALDGPRAQVKLFPFLHGPQERPSRRGSRLLAFGRVPIILLGSGPFFSYFIFVFSIWFVSNGSVGWKESRRLLLQNEKKNHVFVISFVFYRSSLVILIISDVIFLCVDITGCVSYTWMAGCCWARLDDGGGWLINVQLWFVGESQKATEKRSFF